MENEDIHSGKSGLLSAWMQLVRFPNLLTVPGDPVAGFLIAMAGVSINLPIYIPGAEFVLKLTMLATPSILIYAAGLIHNDLCGLKEDRIKSPHRPLASGRISTRSAFLAMVLLFAAGIAMAAVVSFSSSGKWDSMLIVMTLVICVLAYNSIAAKYRIAGCIVMGMCRGLSFLFGASLLFSNPFTAGQNDLTINNPDIPAILAVFGLWVAYIAAVTYLASDETRRFRYTLGKFVPALLIPIWILAVCLSKQGLPNTWHLVVPAIATFSAAFITAVTIIFLLKKDSSPSVIGSSVGMLIRNLILLQASVCFLQPAGLIPGIFLLFFYLGHILLSQRFYAT